MTGESEPNRAQVLVVDDEADIREFCQDALADAGFGVRTAISAGEALQILDEEHVDIVLSDLKMPGVDGIQLLQQIKERAGAVDVVLMTGHATIETAVRAIQMGASDYITKPVSAGDLAVHLNRLVRFRELILENRLLREQVEEQHGSCGLIGTSPRMQEVHRTVLRFAAKRQPVLITGESGTGKELIARALHRRGANPNEPFMPIDCGSLSPNLVESELFGHARGAFTGAMQDRPGLLASARRGTAFLDEIGELPLDLQVKLLRALQERELRPVGSNRPIPLEARIVAATNRNLLEAVREGKFRSDLYYRLNVLAIPLPPLRERKSDIPGLVQYFILHHGGPEEGIQGIAPDALERLTSYHWPGNVRELENHIQRALAVTSGPLLQLNDFAPEIRYRNTAEGGRAYTYLEKLERTAIIETLENTGGHRLRAAEVLGIGKTTLYRKLRDYGLDDCKDAEPVSAERADTV
ncbi:MAG TPA: sigma-54 dependent transcriptional regulator [Bryobacteraceae bacterium]|jgi:two-component system response regulator HydG